MSYLVTRKAKNKLKENEEIEDVNTVISMLDRMCFYFKLDKVISFAMEEFQLDEEEAYALIGRYGHWEDKISLQYYGV